MYTSSPAVNPLAWWMQANFAAMNAAMDVTVAAAKAMTAASGSGGLSASQPEQTRASTPPQPAAAATLSWYRAPYRSPFDPMFWMMPGHPIDHMGDWLGPSMALGASLGNPFATAFTNGGLGAWSGSAWMQPMTIWSDFFAQRSFGADALTRPASNVVDFEKAFSAYRTASGHAAVQVLRSVPPDTVEPARSRSPNDRDGGLWSIAFPFLPWTRLPW